jgi:biopolymer transport protein ExbD
MAEVDTGGGGGKHKGGAPKQKKKSTRIDMTAMVDVAFLLLTFFILTTTLAQPKAMELNKAPKTDDNTNEQLVVEKKVLTLILGENNKIHYYQGVTDPKVKSTDFSADGIRKVIQKHLDLYPNRCNTVDNAPGCWDPIFVLKPNKTSKYKNMVDILDEMRINKVPKYALADFTPEDSLLLIDNNLK